MWVEGVVDNHGINELACVAHTGERLRVEGLPKSSLITKSCDTASVCFDSLELKSLQQVFPEEFISLANYPENSAAGQSVFEFFAAGTRVLVTAAVLLIALLGAHYFARTVKRSVRRSLLNGLSLELLMTSRISKHTSAVHRIGRPTSLAFAERITWLTNFISPRRTWASVQAYATQGRLDFDMPEAAISGAAIGQVVQGTLLVDQVYVATLYPREAPLNEWARDLSFNGLYPEIELSPKRKLALEASLPMQKDAWELTAGEWHQFRSSPGARVAGIGPSSELAQQFLLLRHGFRVHPHSWHRLRAIALDLATRP